MHVNPWSAVRTTGCDRDRDGVCDGVVLQQRVDCFASALSVLSHLCVFMQLSLRSVWRCTWMAIAAPLATCGGYGRMAGGGHGVGGMRKACCLCQVEVMFQQRMCRLFCMALDVRLKALSLRGANCCVSNLCVCVPCVRAAMPTTWVSFVLQFSLRPWCCLFCSCLCFVVLFVLQLSLRRSV